MYFMKYILSICTFLPMLLGLFLLATKLTSKQYSKLSNKRYVKIIEKTAISKDTYSIVMKIGDTTCVGISSPNGFQMIKELDKIELANLEPEVNLKEEIDYIKTLAPILKTIGANTKVTIEKTIKNIQLNKFVKENKTRWK